MLHFFSKKKSSKNTEYKNIQGHFFGLILVYKTKLQTYGKKKYSMLLDYGSLCINCFVEVVLQ